jgi:hypothetical protein
MYRQYTFGRPRWANDALLEKSHKQDIEDRERLLDFCFHIMRGQFNLLLGVYEEFIEKGPQGDIESLNPAIEFLDLELPKFQSRFPGENSSSAK